MSTTQAEAEAAFRQYAHQYPSLVEQVSTAPHTEIWSTGVLHEIEPMENQRGGFKVGKAMKSAPAKTKGKCLQFLDPIGRLIYRKTGTELPDCFYEEFFLYEGDTILGLYFGASRSKELLHAKIRVVSQGLVTTAASYGKYGTRTESFHYEGPHLVKMEVHERQHDGQSSEHLVVVEHGAPEPVVTRHFPNGRITQIYP